MPLLSPSVLPELLELLLLRTHSSGRNRQYRPCHQDCPDSHLIVICLLAYHWISLTRQTCCPRRIILLTTRQFSQIRFLRRITQIHHLLLYAGSSVWNAYMYLSNGSSVRYCIYLNLWMKCILAMAVVLDTVYLNLWMKCTLSQLWNMWHNKVRCLSLLQQSYRVIEDLQDPL